MVDSICPTCGRAEKLREFLRGMTVICKGCGQRMEVSADGVAQPRASSVEVISPPTDAQPPRVASPPKPDPPAAPVTLAGIAGHLAGASSDEFRPWLFWLRPLPPGTSRAAKVAHAILFTVGWLFFVWGLIDGTLGFSNLFIAPGQVGPVIRSQDGEEPRLRDLGATIAFERGMAQLMLAVVWLVVSLCLQGVRVWLANGRVAEYDRRELQRQFGHPVEEEVNEPGGTAMGGAIVGAIVGFFFGPPLMVLALTAVGRQPYPLQLTFALTGTILGPFVAGYVLGYLVWAVVAVIRRE